MNWKARHFTLPLAILLAACIARLWLAPLSSSFWVDEMVTAFVVHYGPAHPSLAVAPQVPASIYYVLPRAAESLWGFSEAIYRLPSVLLMGIALWLIARLSIRLIHPESGWLAVFACLALQGISYEADDARPYALAIAVASAAMLFLVRWLDYNRSIDAALFVVFAALLWRVHLINWPVYGVFAMYAIARLIARETPVSVAKALAIFILLAAALVPVGIRALALAREAAAHVIVPPPHFRELRNALKLGLPLALGGSAAFVSRVRGWTHPKSVQWTTTVLILGWWLWQPLAIFLFSKLTGESLFVSRYLSVALPGVALTAVLAVSYYLPSYAWRPAAVVFGLWVLIFMGAWNHRQIAHGNSDWRAASAQVNQLGWGPSTPVIFPSVFIEARPPVWRPDYPLPGFLYCHLLTYPISGKPYLLPFEDSPEAEQYATTLASGVLQSAGKFAIYGGDRNVWTWQKWFEERPELAGWSNRLLGPFGDVEVAVFESPLSASSPH
jgi:hypothetical protein